MYRKKEYFIVMKNFFLIMNIFFVAYWHTFERVRVEIFIYSCVNSLGKNIPLFLKRI